MNNSVLKPLSCHDIFVEDDLRRDPISILILYQENENSVLVLEKF